MHTVFLGKLTPTQAVDADAREEAIFWCNAVPYVTRARVAESLLAEKAPGGQHRRVNNGPHALAETLYLLCIWAKSKAICPSMGCVEPRTLGVWVSPSRVSTLGGSTNSTPMEASAKAATKFCATVELDVAKSSLASPVLSPLVHAVLPGVGQKDSSTGVGFLARLAKAQTALRMSITVQ